MYEVCYSQAALVGMLYMTLPKEYHIEMASAVALALLNQI